MDRAYPFLEREGLRNNFLYSARGKALDVQVVIPQKLGWTPRQLRSPRFQQRFMTGFHHALGQIAPSRISPARAPAMPGLVRGDRFHLSQEEAESRLKRGLTGDPTRGEIGLLEALSANKLDDVQGRLARDTSLGQDLRELVTEHLQKARARWETRKAWSVSLPLPVWDEYARESRITGRSVSECLVAAIRRDYERRKGTLEPMETLDQNVRAFHAAATQLLQEARQVIEHVGPLQETGMRLSRIEGASGGQVRR